MRLATDYRATDYFFSRVVLISIIIPTCNEEKNIARVVGRLSKQPGGYEIIIVDGNGIDETLAQVEDQVKLLSIPHDTAGAQLNAGAAAAQGDILFFLDLHTRLPPNALQAIKRNFKLLPQTIGGNFHLEFVEETLFTKLLICLLKWWRYRGSYCGNSGIFIRKEAYEAMGGFRPDVGLTDYDFAHRMEKFGPTIYLPEAVIAPVPNLWEAIRWITAPIFMKLKT